MIKTNKAGAVATLQDLLTTLPADLDARSEFFLSWKNRVTQSLELIFQDDPQPCQQFKDIEFSPRRLTNNETRDDQLRLDAYLAGCAAARTILESFLWRLSSADEPQADPSAPILTVSRAPEAKAPAAAPAAPGPRPQPTAPAAPSPAPYAMVHPDYAPEPTAPVKPLMSPDTVVLPPSPGQVEAMERKLAMENAAREKAAQQKAAKEQAERERLEREKAEQERVQREQAEAERQEREQAKRLKAERERERAERERVEEERARREKKAQREAERAERHREKLEKPHRVKPKPHREADESPVISGASMSAADVCSPVRGSLARMLSAWDDGDRDTAAVVSAQLLADLSMLAHQDRFKAAFEHVVSRAFAPEVAEQTLQTLKTAGPLCVWSLIAAMNEVMKA